MTYRYEAISKNNMSLRPDHYTNNTPIKTIQAGSKMHGDVIWEDVIGEKWLNVLDVNGVLENGWVAIIHQNTPYCTLTEINPPTTGNVYPDKVTLHYPDNMVKDYFPR